MRHPLVRAVIGIIAAIALAGCAVTEARRQQQREALTRRITDDAIAYNEAYSGAISGQILLNILRAYNRQPRQYMSMSGFNNSSPDSQSNSLGVSGLPLGQLGQQWGTGALGLNTTTQLEPQYTVSPFGADAYAKIALRPTSDTVFRYYWDTGWNRDMLLILLVDQMEVASGIGPARTLSNSAGTIARNCEGGDYAERGCAFVLAARDLAARTRELRLIAPPHAQAGICQPIAVYEVPGVRSPDPVQTQGANACPIGVIVGGARYALRLRSLDDMIYYVGELLRRDALAPNQMPAGALEARLNVVAPGSRDELTPLFRIVPADRQTERQYAATVTYAGRRYSAGAPADAFCYDPTSQNRCQGGGAADRSGTVLELLAGILAHNQSEAAVSAPQSAIFRER